MKSANSGVSFPIRSSLTAACLFAITSFAMSQSTLPPDNTHGVTVSISQDRKCYLLDDSTPCERLGEFLLKKHLPDGEHIHFKVDRDAKYELVAATVKSLQGKGFKVGFVNSE